MKTMLFATLVAAVSLPLMAQDRPDNVFALPPQTETHMEAAIPRPEQERESAAKLAALESKFGRKPNIVILLVDE